MYRSHTLTLRLSPDELAMLSAIRNAFDRASRTDAVILSLEDMCRRIGEGEDVGQAISEADRELCASALQTHLRQRGRRSYAGRPPNLTPTETQALDCLRIPIPRGGVLPPSPVSTGLP